MSKSDKDITRKLQTSIPFMNTFAKALKILANRIHNILTNKRIQQYVKWVIRHDPVGFLLRMQGWLNMKIPLV